MAQFKIQSLQSGCVGLNFLGIYPFYFLLYLETGNGSGQPRHNPARYETRRAYWHLSFLFLALLRDGQWTEQAMTQPGTAWNEMGRA